MSSRMKGMAFALRAERKKTKTLEEKVERLSEENHTLEMMAWEYERVWEWLMENADYTCRKLLLLIEEWKEEDGLVTIDGVTYKKEMIQ